MQAFMWNLAELHFYKFSKSLIWEIVTNVNERFGSDRMKGDGFENPHCT